MQNIQHTCIKIYQQCEYVWYIYYIYSITKQLKKNKLFNLQLYKLKYKK